MITFSTVIFEIQSNFLFALFQLNVLHWHLADTQSFPIQLEKYPNTTAKMAQYGAYGPDKIYSVNEVEKLVVYANKRGEKTCLS